MKVVQKRVIAILLIALLVFTALPLDSVFASETNNDQASTETQINMQQEAKNNEAEENTDELIVNQDTEETEETEAEDEEETVSETEMSSDVEPLDGLEMPEELHTSEETGVSEEMIPSSQFEEQLVNFLVVQKPYLEIPDTQKVVVDIGDDTTQIEKATLYYHCIETKTNYSIDANTIEGSSILFSILYENEEQKGKYTLDSIQYEQNGEKYTVVLSEIGLDIVYGVDTIVDTQPDATIIEEGEEEPDLDIVTYDEDGNVVSDNSIEDAIEGLKTDENIVSKEYGANRNVVVVLDAGHGGTDSGATGNGLYEKNLTLKIAQYCKEELEKYSGVSVYMTRTSDTYVGLEDRVAYAKSVGADLFVSIHINSYKDSTASGAEVYYPNNNYNPTANTVGSGVASSILSKLTNLGIGNRGIKIKDSANGTTYPDGSLADYYSVIRNSKLSGFAGIIVEHAFISNPADTGNFLNDDYKLQQLGIADATGIAEYYGLGKETKYSEGAATFSVDKYSNSKYKVSASGIEKANGVKYAVWSAQNGADDLVWYDTVKDSNGRWSTDIQLSNHNAEGDYIVYAYITCSDGTAYFVGNTTFSVSASISAKVDIYNINNVSGTFSVMISDIDSTFGVNKVQVPVWSKNDMSDIVWYEATEQGDGTYNVNVDIANHKCNYGTYNVQTYISDQIGTRKSVAVTSTNLENSEAYLNCLLDSSRGRIDISSWHVPGTLGKSLTNVEYLVWSAENGMDDLVSYNAVASSDKWIASVNLSDHKSFGTYYIHAYAVYKNGTKEKIGEASVDVGKSAVENVAIENVNTVSGTFDVKISGVYAPSGVSSVQVPVWCKNDQSDIVWYTANANLDGTYSVHVDVADHNCNYGMYQVHTYIQDQLGIMECVDTTSVEMNKENPQITTTLNNSGKNCEISAWHVPGTFGKSLSNVIFAVWSADGGMDDLVFYSASASADKWNANVSLADHKSSGLYYVHTYATYTNGVQEKISEDTFEVAKSKVDSISISNLNTVSGVFDINIKGAYDFSGVSSVQVPVWSKENQSDIKWYSAELQKDGSYTVHVDIANHDCNFGTYYIHTYIQNAIGTLTLVDTKKVEVQSPKTNVEAKTDSMYKEYSLSAWHVPGTFGQSLKNVEFAVWSDDGGQDDLAFYSASPSDDSWVANVPIINHKSAGMYYVHVYATYVNGARNFVGSTTFEVTRTKVDSVEVNNINTVSGTFDLSSKGIHTISGVNEVQYAIWSSSDQSDIKWYTGIQQTDGAFTAHVDVANHNCNFSKYNVHTYVINNIGLRECVDTKTVDMNSPVTEMTVTPNSIGSDFSVSAWHVPGTCGNSLIGVQYAVWSEKDGQDDLVWYNAGLAGDIWNGVISISNHRTAGVYDVHAYAIYANGKKENVGITKFTVTEPTASTVMVQNQDTNAGTFQIKVSGVSSGAEIVSVRVPVWCASDQSDLVWYDATKIANGEYVAYVDASNHHNNLGVYTADVYAYDAASISAYLGRVNCSVTSTSGYYNIVGSSVVNLQQLVRYYCNNASYPAFYAGSDAPTIESFCQMYLEECNAEGIKAEVAFCQAMKETGFLRYGGDVNITQYNFAGLGATGGGNPGNSFSSVREGIRAQVQHLKAYASTEDLNNTCVDSRFKYVSRGCAPYVEWLGIHENPYGKGWAAAINYGYSVKSDYIAKLVIC